jgi:hypothetical protein
MQHARPVPTAAQTHQAAPQGSQLVRLPHRAFSRAPDVGQAGRKPLEHVSCWRRCERPAEKDVNGYPRPKRFQGSHHSGRQGCLEAPPLHPACKTGARPSPTSVGAAQDGDFPPGSSPPNRQVRMQKAGGRKPASSIPRVAHRCAHLPGRLAAPRSRSWSCESRRVKYQTAGPSLHLSFLLTRSIPPNHQPRPRPPSRVALTRARDC